MNKIYILKSNGHVILNFIDLQEHFSPWEFLDQKRSFESFAKIHCKPLGTWAKSENGGKTKTEHINKAFWLNVLGRDWMSEELDGERSAFDYICDYSYFLLVDSCKEEANEKREKEIERLFIEEKINFICNEAVSSQSKEDKITAILLLAICEISEMDARQQNFQRWKQNEKSESEDNISETAPENEVAAAENLTLPDAFPKGSRLALSTSPVPYRFLYHESDDLKADEIRTVRIEAVEGTGETVSITLCKENGEVLVTVELKAGEYRDCNVSDDRIIRFLPTLSISDTLCLARKNYSSPDITVIPRDAMEWTLNIDSSIARKITSFSAGNNETEGFLCIRDGKLMRGFYKPNDNYKTKQRLDMVKERLVEVRIINGYFELLTEGGKVISDNTERNGLKNVVTLYPRTRQEKPEVREIAYSAGGRSAVKHNRITEECEVEFN